MSPGRYYVKLRSQIERLWPADAFALADLSVLDRIWIAPADLQIEQERAWIETGILFQDTLEVALPGIDAVSLSLGDPASGTDIDISTDIYPAFSASIGPLDIRINIASDLLRPAERISGPGPGRFRPIENTRLSLTLAQVVASFDLAGNITIETDYALSLPPVMIGTTGIVIEAQTVRSVLSDRDAAALSRPVPPGARGLFLDGVSIYLPEEFSVAIPSDITIEDCFVGTCGLSGRFTGNWTPQLTPEGRHFTGNGAGELFGIPFGLSSISLAVVDNVPTEIDIRGHMLVPYFDGVADVRVHLDSVGRISVSLAASSGSGLTLTKEELLALNIKSLAVGKNEDNVGELVISGGLEPLLMASDGLKWPKLDVKDLYIDSTGKFSIKEAWLDLKDLATLDLWGFHFELRRIGIGSEQRDDPDGDRLWVDLSGGLHLIEQIPVGLDVEGFRLTWPQNLLQGISAPTIGDIQTAVSKIEVKFDGIYLFFGVPDAVEFEGLIRFFKDAQIVGFAGDMALRVPASGFGAEAGLLVGMNFEPPPYPFVYVYFGVDLPAGIPLGQSGLALKGAQGMFGLNVVPDKAPEENWYYDWYKRGPIVGAHPTNKWKPGRDALALGVGVTITSADGYVKGTRGLLVLSIPGPILIIEGRALILSGLNPNAEPPLRALAVFDGIAGTAQFNIEAEATLIEDMLEAHGMLEAFFDFNDLTNWHLYLGQDEPRDRRIRASVLKCNDAFLFKADAYLMIDMVGAGTLRSRIGAFIGFDPPIPDVGPVKIDFHATLEGDGVVTVRPEQLSGDIDLSASIGLSAFGFDAQLSASAGVLTEGPDPIKVGANVHIEAETPAPLDPVEAEVEFAWESPPEPKIESPLAEITVNSRFAPSGGGFKADAGEEKNRIHDVSAPSDFESLRAQWRQLAEASPVVPVDSQPVIAFGHEMNAEFFARHPDGEDKHYDLGLVRFTPALTQVELYEHQKEENDSWLGADSDWTLIASSDASGHKPLPGVWLSESDPQSPDEPSARRAQLWTDNPLCQTGRALGAGYSQFLGALRPGKPAAERILQDYPDLMKCEYTKTKTVCVNFKEATGVVIDPGVVWEHEELRFIGTFRPARVQSITETIATPAPRLTPAKKRAVQEALSRRAPEFRNPANITARQLQAWAATVSDLERKSLRRERPDLDWLWDWLFPRTVIHACLFVDGYLDIHFPRKVHKASVTFCRPSKLSTSAIQVRVKAKRRARTLAELAALSDDARRSGKAPDLRACTREVQAAFTISEREWIIEADAGFDCLNIVRMDEFAIEEICYVTAEEHERAELAKHQCEANANPPGEGRTLRPGCYYRLDVTTSVLGRLNLDALPFSRSGLLGSMMVAAYEEVMGLLGFGDDGPPKTFHQVAFFQTESPPKNLRPYVKWSSPPHQADRVFYEDDLAIRFLRANVAEMFGAPYKVEIQIRDAQAKLVPGYATEWLKARTATLFAEEQVWQEYRSSLDWPPAATTKDDLLIAKRTGAAPLGPNARYEAQVVRTDDLVEPGDTALFSTTFTTSAFASFTALADSYGGQAVPIAAKPDYQASRSMIPDLIASTGALARAESEWLRAQVDYRFETLDGRRKGLEQARIKRRQARAPHDANFRRLVESLAELYFRPFSERLEVYVVKDENTGRPVCVWLRSPESLDLRMAVPQDPIDDAAHRIDYVGRTEVIFRRQGSTAPAPAKLLHNADSTQVLFLPTSNTAWTSGLHNLVFTYRRDYGDETSGMDHRYDRPQEFRSGSSDPQESVPVLEFTL